MTRPLLFPCLLSALLLSAVLCSTARAAVVLSEFMAANQDTLKDGNGNPSDWIELFNDGDTAVNLAGWRLTDDPLDPAKWMFPSVTLGPGQFLVVFASGRGVPDAAGKLHTSFQLNSAGDYLGLLQPDGFSVASQFSPVFPAQRTDVSYGLAQRVSSTNLVRAGSVGRLVIPTATLFTQVALTWTGGAEQFDDSGWTGATVPVGFDTPRLAAGTNGVNVALGRPVLAKGETWGGLPKENLTDGDPSTFTHNLDQDLDFYFIVDLGATYALENLELFNRNDGCCPERLSNYTVSLLADSGAAPGPVVWSANIRINGSNSGIGGRDVLTAGLDPAGTFAGRWVKVQARNNGVLRYFQIAELRAQVANWAQGSAVSAAGETWPGLPKENITDGNLATFSHNLDLAPAFFYQIRLSNSVALRRLEIFNRNDGCCPDRLSRYRVSLHPDAFGLPGPAGWSADVRSDGSSSGPGGVDVLTAELDRDGTFEGQWIQIQNIDVGIPRHLQIAEVRALGVAGSSGYQGILRQDISGLMKGVNSAAWLRLPFTLNGASNINQLTLGMNGDDGFIAYLNGTEVARRRAPPGQPPFNAAATRPHFAAGAESISIPVGLLREGSNILALIGLNISETDGDFLLAPELVAAQVTAGGTGYFLAPTPGGPNGSNVVSGFVSSPRFSVDRGFFEAPTNVVIFSPTPGATLVYTTNSSIPSSANGVVLVPTDGASSLSVTVRVSTTTILRAVAFKSGLQPSSIDTHTYLFLADVIRQPAAPAGFPALWNGFPADYQMDPKVVNNAAYAGEILADLKSIPTLSIVVHPSDLFGATDGIYVFSEQVGDAWERAASVEWIRPDGTSMFQADCGLRLWGTGWRPHTSSPKHALQLKFQSQYGQKRLHQPIFPDSTVAEFDNLVLRAQGSRSWGDFRQPDIEQTQYIHDSWARDTRRDMGNNEGHSTYVHLYLNGLYWGLYNPVEKTDEGFAQIHEGGDKSEYDVITRRSTPEADAGDLVAWNEMLAVVNGGLAAPAAYDKVQQYLDVDDFIDYMMVHQYASNHDGPTYNANNMRAIRRRVPGGQFRFHVWDMEYTFWYAQEDNLSVDIDQSPARIFQRLRDNPEFRLRYADHARRHLFNNGPLTPAAAAGRWLARATEIAGAVVGESARWGDIRRSSPPYTRNVEWTNELNRLLTEYFPVRSDIFLNQLRREGLYPAVEPPSFNQAGGDIPPGFQLQFDAPQGTVFYTVDGTDPRQPGGAIGAGALQVTPNSLLVTTGSTVRVRVPTDASLGLLWNGSDPGFNDSSWLSGPNAAGFDATLASPPVPMALTNATADFSQTGFPVGAMIDGVLTSGGWGLYQPDFVNKGRGAIAVFETVTNAGSADGTRLTFSLRFRGTPGANLGCYRLSATTDDRLLFANGLTNRGDVTATWQVLHPLSAVSSGGAALVVREDGSILATGANPGFDTNTIVVVTALTGLTGFRLEALEDSSLPGRGPGRYVGIGMAGNAVVSDFTVQAAPATLAHLVGSGLSGQLLPAMQNVNATLYLRAGFTLTPGPAFDQLSLRMRYEDGFVAYLNGHEIARRQAPAVVTWNSAASGNRARGLALEFEEMDVTPGLAFLQTGANTLAIHGLNDAAVSTDFLLQPELIARSGLRVPLDETVTVQARVLLDGQWSALTEATFNARFPLQVTEIMYNPPASSDGFVGGDEYEFLELRNTGTRPLNLGGYTFTSGLVFTFPSGFVLGPGAFAVLVRNPAQFGLRYPGVAVAGVYSGGLANNGETVRLNRPNNGPVALEITFGDAPPWPSTADGLGFSLVPKILAGPPAEEEGNNWRASAFPLGSPGAVDPTPTTRPVVINEILAASTLPDVDQVELANLGVVSAPIGGWYLSDDRQTPRKYRIPDGRSLGAGGFTVFAEADFNSVPGASNSFALSSGGDSLYLFAADSAGNLTGYSHAVRFEASAPGVSLGRHLTSLNEERFPAQLSLTLGSPNSGPRVGPVVITEVMYHPPPGGDEFVELLNITAAAVSLFDPAHPTNTWRLSGFDAPFPQGLTLPAGGRMLVVAGDPALFRLKYGIPSAVALLGPVAGQLQDSGERLELKRPETPGTNGVPFVTVDAVRYNDRAPWPAAADGHGPSLQRLDPAVYGDDVVNWIAAAPTPGFAPTAGVPPSITAPPAPVVVVRYQPAQFSVGAGGSAVLRYQWQFNGAELPGATHSLLLLTNAQPAQAGTYRVTVFNESGAVVSPAASLTLLEPPTILFQPQGFNVLTGTPVTFAVAAIGSGPLTYQWQHDGVPIPGANSSTYAISGVQIPDAGMFTVLVTDSVGTTPSVPARLNPLVLPVILQPPLGQAVAVGAPVTVSVVVSGFPLPFGFEWRKGPAVIASNTVQATTTFFTFPASSVATTQVYRVVVRNLANPGGSTVTTTFNISTQEDGDGDGLPDTWETGYGFNPALASDGLLDSDGDGALNWEEFVAGTDPRSAASVLRLENVVLGADGLRYEFQAVAGRTYGIQTGDSLKGGTWGQVLGVPAAATNRIIRGTNSLSVAPGARFLRLVTPAR